MRIGDIVIDIPDDWDDHSLYSFVAPASAPPPALRAKATPTFRTNVVLQRRRVADDENLDDAVGRARESTARDFGADVAVTITDGPSAAGAPTRVLHYKVVDPATSLAVQQVVYLAVLAGMEWQIAFSAPAADTVRARFDRIVQSIRLI